MGLRAGKRIDDHPLVEMALQCVSDSERWFPDASHDVGHHVLSMIGEVGEFANILKKIQRGSLDSKEAMVQHELAMELTDVFIYLLNIAGLMRINLAAAYEHKRQINEQRFGKEHKNGQQ